MQLSSNNILDLPLLGSWDPDTIQDEKSREWKNFGGASNLRLTNLYSYTNQPIHNIAWTNNKSSKSQAVCNTEY